MDGVLCDFLRLTSILTGETLSGPKDWYLVKDTVWTVLAEYGTSFWEALPWTEDGKELWEFVEQFNPSILSAYPASEANQTFAIIGKQVWVRRELNNYTNIHIVKAVEKQDFAHKNAILIDDHGRNIKQFESKGGIGITHISTKKTIKQLKRILCDCPKIL